MSQSARHGLSGTQHAIGFRMAPSSVRTLELISPRAALTPCILDDDPAQLQLMTELVASAGFEAVAAADREEALQLLRSGRSR